MHVKNIFYKPFIKYKWKKLVILKVLINLIICYNKLISSRSKRKINKKIQKMLDEKNRVKGTDLKQIFSSNDINEEETEHLVNVYNRYLNNSIKNNNIKKKIDSLLFLSEMSSKRISKIKVQSCIKNKTLNFEKCRKFLKETERLKIVLPEKYEEFKKKNNIYFDDENHKDLPRGCIIPKNK